MNICGMLEHGIELLGDDISGFMESNEEMYIDPDSVDITQYRASEPYTYPTKENEVFTGWYIDAMHEEQVDNEFITEGRFYPRYAHVDTMRTKFAKKNTDTALIQCTFYSSVPCHFVKEIGFYINGTKTKVVGMSTSLDLFGTRYDRTQFHEQSIYLFKHNAVYMPYTNVRIKSYIVTLDGTEVTGTESTFIVF